MKLTGPVLALVCLAGGWFGHAYVTRPTATIRALRDSSRTLDTSADSLDSSLAVRRDSDSVAVAEPLQHAHVLHDRGAVLGDSAAHLQARTDSALTALDTANATVREAVTALAQERAAKQRQLDTLQAAYDSLGRAFRAANAQLHYYRDVAVNDMRIQRDRARQLLAEALSIKPKRCGLGGGPGAGYGLMGFEVGLHIGYVCVL